MIEKKKDRILIYLTADFKPTTKEKAELIKIIPARGAPVFLSVVAPNQAP